MSIRTSIALISFWLAMPVFGEPKATSDKADEVYEFQFDKEKVMKRASFLSNGWDVEHPLFSSVRGIDCKGKPARYVVVLVNSTTRDDFPQYIVLNTSDAHKWHVYSEGAGGTSLSALISQLRSPDLPESVECVGC